MVGYDASDTDFDALQETGGAKTKTLSISEIPAHTHNQGSHDSTAGDGGAYNTEFIRDHSDTANGPNVESSSTGGGSAFSIMNPYIVAYMWRRTA
jgi:microcystin-dependent protein